MKGSCTTVYETKYFEIYHDARGRYWVWNKLEEINHAYRAPDEITAYRNAMDSAIYQQQLCKYDHAVAAKKLGQLEDAFNEAFPRDPDEDW